MKTKLSIIALLLLLPARSVAQTTIAVVRDSQGLVLAADSRGTPPQNPSQFVRICKIHNVGGFWFAAAGHIDTGLNNEKVNVRASLEQADRAPGRLRDKAEAFVQLFEPEINRLIAEIQRSESSYYKAKIIGKPVVEVVFAAIENGIPIYLTRDFIGPETPNAPARVRIARDDQLDELKPNLIQLSCRGYCTGARAFIVENRRSILQLGIDELARFIVAYEILERPDIVGAPIDILRLRRSGVADWIQRKQECEESKKTGFWQPRKIYFPSHGVCAHSSIAASRAFNARSSSLLENPAARAFSIRLTRDSLSMQLS